LVGFIWMSDQSNTVLYLTTHYTHKRQKSILLEKFEHTYIFTNYHNQIRQKATENQNSVTLENCYLQVDGRTDGWTDRQTDRQIDRYVGRYINIFSSKEYQ
jgi:hypothetical protein